MTTLTELKKEFGGTTAPLKEISVKYLGVSPRKACDMATTGTLPLPTFRLGSQKSPWLVEVADLAKLIDHKKAEAVQLMNSNQVQTWPILRHKKKGTPKVP